MEERNASAEETSTNGGDSGEVTRLSFDVRSALIISCIIVAGLSFALWGIHVSILVLIAFAAAAAAIPGGIVYLIFAVRGKMRRVTIWECLAWGFIILAFVCVVVHCMELILWGLGTRLPVLFIVLFALRNVAVPVAGLYLILRALSERLERWESKRILRVIMAAILLLAAVFHFSGEEFVLVDIGMRLNVARTGGIEQLRAWAIEVLQRPEGEVLVHLDERDYPCVRTELLTEQVMILSQDDIVSIGNTDGGRYVYIRVGGERELDAVWGIIISLPDTEIWMGMYYDLYRWGDGVYGFVVK